MWPTLHTACTTLMHNTYFSAIPFTICTKVYSANVFFVAFNIANKVSDEDSSGYYFSNGSLSIMEPYSREISMRSCSNNNISITFLFSLKTSLYPASKCFQRNTLVVSQLLRTAQSLSVCLLIMYKYQDLKYRGSLVSRSVSQMALIVPQGFITQLMYILSQLGLWERGWSLDESNQIRI